MTTTELFSAEDLGQALQVAVDAGAAAMAERVVWGWLSPVLGVEDRPDSVSPQLFSWAVELGAMFYSNPEGLASYSLGEESSSFSSRRRDEILAAVGASTSGSSSGVPSPTGCFPAARAYPDPAERC